MKARVLFGVGGFVFVLLALYVFPPVVLAVVLAALCGLAAYELTGATGLVKNHMVQLECIGAAVLMGFAGGAVFLAAVLALCLMLALFVQLLRHHDAVTFPEIAVAMFGGLALPLLLTSLWRIFSMEGGSFLVLLPLVAAWGSDTCALFAGMAFGKHKLAPVISPKKTVEGAVGGVAGATALMLLVVFLFNRYAGLDIHYGAAALMGAGGAVIGQIGDLSFSIIKRQTGIKDYGHIFPGHGGVLDRFDSVVFVAPAAELILRAFGVI